MLIPVGNIGRSLSAVTGNGVRISDRWNNASGRNTIGQHGDGAIGGGPKFIARPQAVARFVTGYVFDAQRSWTAPYTDIGVAYDAKVQDPALQVDGTATGHTILIGGVAQTTTYRSGSGTGSWMFRIPVATTAASAITYSYSQAAGATVNVLGGAELATITAQPIKNYLSKRIRFVLKKSDGTACVSESVKLALLGYAGGVAGDSATAWMTRLQGEVATTDGSGQIDVPLRTVASVGDTVYVMAIRTNTSPSESMLWTTTVT